jgi:ribosomal protein S18 acetylase RimI-like enzyme
MELRSYTTKELSPRTWVDFEHLFLRKSRWGGCWRMVFHQVGKLPKAQKGGMTRGRVARSRRDKKALVEEGRSHGILVYSGREPVGWCQYGSSEELSRIDTGTIYRKLSLDNEGKRLWRITCFWVDRRKRNQGVAAAALRAAIDSIRKQGGKLIEAYPVVSKGFPADWTGTLSMFRKEGFEVVAPFGKYNVLVRRTI